MNEIIGIYSFEKGSFCVPNILNQILNPQQVYPVKKHYLLCSSRSNNNSLFHIIQNINKTWQNYFQPNFKIHRNFEQSNHNLI